MPKPLAHCPRCGVPLEALMSRLAEAQAAEMNSARRSTARVICDLIAAGGGVAEIESKFDIELAAEAAERRNDI